MKCEVMPEPPQKWQPYPEYARDRLTVSEKHPAEWVAKRLRFAMALNPSKREVTRMDPDTRVTFLPMENVSERGSLDLAEERRLEDVRSGFTYCADGDVLIAKITPCFENGKGALCDGLRNGIGFGSTEFHVCRPHDELDNRFLFYVSRSHGFRKHGAMEMKGTAGQKRVTDDYLKNFRTALPPPAEQRRIAGVLDLETEKIDLLIAEKEKLIGLLEEKQEAAICSAVTRGLGLTKLRDSGVPWLGSLPATWHLLRTRFLCRITTGSRDSREAEVDGEYPLFLRSPVVARTSTFAYDCEGVLTSGDGAGVGKIFHYYVGKFDVHQRVYLFYDFRHVLARYFYYYIRANLAKVVLADSAKATFDSVRLPMLKDFVVAFGERAQQAEIVTHLDRICEGTQKACHAIREQVGLLEEHRAALIAAAVTGRIDVREDAP